MKQTHRPPRSIYPAQNRHMRRRTRVLAGLVAVLCFGGLLVRLFTLQILDPSGYANRAAAQQLRDTTLPAARGEIYSADGVILATSKTCWTIRASPRELADELVRPAAKALSEILDIDYGATLQKLSKRTSNDCLLRRRVLDQAGLNGDDLMRSRAKKSSLCASPQLGHRVLGLVAVMPRRPAAGDRDLARIVAADAPQCVPHPLRLQATFLRVIHMPEAAAAAELGVGASPGDSVGRLFLD